MALNLDSCEENRSVGAIPDCSVRLMISDSAGNGIACEGILFVSMTNYDVKT